MRSNEGRRAALAAPGSADLNGGWHILLLELSRMNRLPLLILLGALALSGCARHYVLTLHNGSQVDAWGKPKLTNGNYHFKNAQGKDSQMSASRVSEIAPASMVRDEQKALTPPKPARKRHWYYLWLA
jgi:hypothetical protein